MSGSRRWGRAASFIDSMSHLDTLSADPMERRMLAVSLLNALKQRGLTVLVTRKSPRRRGMVAPSRSTWSMR